MKDNEHREEEHKEERRTKRKKRREKEYRAGQRKEEKKRGTEASTFRAEEERKSKKNGRAPFDQHTTRTRSRTMDPMQMMIQEEEEKRRKELLEFLDQLVGAVSEVPESSWKATVGDWRLYHLTGGFWMARCTVDRENGPQALGDTTLEGLIVRVVMEQ